MADELRADKDLVLQALANRDFPAKLEDAAPALRQDKEVILASLLHRPETLRDLDEKDDKLLADMDFILAATDQNPFALQYVPTWKLNKTVVLAAVARGGWALQHAPQELKGDKDVVHAAVRNTPQAL